MTRAARSLVLPCTLAVLGLTLATGLGAQGTPKRKPGLWQQSVTHSVAGIPPSSMSMCTDEKTDDLMASRAGGEQRCTQQSMKQQGNSFVIEAVCKEGATTIRTRGVFSGDFSTRYSGELRSTFEPPMHGMKEMTQKMEARWVGPCKPGQKPGDVVVEGARGMNMNMNEMMGDPKKMQEMMNDPTKRQELMQQMQQMQQQMQQKPK